MSDNFDNFVEDLQNQIFEQTREDYGDVVKGKNLEYARNIDDNDVFNQLEDIPAKKHPCIQLAVKALHKAIDEYKNGNGRLKNMECRPVCSAPGDCCKNKEFNFNALTAQDAK